MIGGLITPPLVVMKFTVAFTDSELHQYAISAALITSGICTIINVMQIKVPFTNYYIGSGILSVLGTSFTFLPIFESSIGQMKGACPKNGAGFPEQDCVEAAYGKMLGTSMVCCLLEVFLAFLPAKALKKIFPPIVTCITVMLIGVALTGTGMKYWGGGVVCAEMGWKTHSQIPEGTAMGPPGSICFGNGTSKLLYGDSAYIGLGFVVITTLVVIELFGSIFLKNCNVILALLVGYLVSYVAPPEDATFVNSSNIESAPWFSFLWVKTFPLGFYGPAVIPLLIAYLVTTVETVGDINGKCWLDE